ncbi:hypothetical protein V1477_012599 [Vespula maculifrons]|uniref:Uncharacterized protein n=1 Tax=Vespula maculifrons TaxID=7453 RepID=A0ABD2BU23_VESMC
MELKGREEKRREKKRKEKKRNDGSDQNQKEILEKPTSDPGPTAWRLLHLETRGLTVTLLFTTTLLSRKQSNGATSTPDEFKPPNAKIAAPCVSAFGNRLTHSSTIQHRKLRSPLEHDRLCFRDKRRNPKLNLPQSRYLREHSGNTHANMLNTRHKRVSFYLARTGEKKSFYARVPRWSLGDETLAARGNTRTNGDSTLKSTIRDAFPLRVLRASQQTGDIAPLSTPSASNISRHDRSCLSFVISKIKTKSSVGLFLAIANTHARAGRHQSNEVHYRRTFNRAREHHACARRHTHKCSFYPTRIRA